MTNHYYSQEPTTEHDFEQWSFELKGKNFQFVTDSGVFSRETVDFGSRVLIDTFNWEELPADGKFWMLVVAMVRLDWRSLLLVSDLLRWSILTLGQ